MEHQLQWYERDIRYDVPDIQFKIGIFGTPSSRWKFGVWSVEFHVMTAVCCCSAAAANFLDKTVILDIQDNIKIVRHYLTL